MMLQQIVSQKRRRYIDDKFNIDLTYITDRIIAMSYPARGFESLYRNNIQQVKEFMDCKHPQSYFIFNLCAEQNHQYPKDFFDFRVFNYPTFDHCPPTLDLLCRLVYHAYQILQSNIKNVVVFHCKAGKGRTGLAVCALLSYLSVIANKKQSANDIIKYYGQQRATNNIGLTIRSQIRYVNYLHVLFQNNLQNNQIRQIFIQPSQLNVVGIKTNIQIKNNIIITSNRKGQNYFQNTINQLIINENDEKEQQYKIKQFDIENTLILKNEISIEVPGHFYIYFWANMYINVNNNIVQFSDNEIDFCNKKQIKGAYFSLILKNM
ncbi:4 [Hexamita inflata]|uniref:phosphatidylinositol-3,4,5-trisphosphate 3-phosphatase n=1 Tax=Hexamita inflata TaxID=28002 RepID=A0ABP1MJ19_9EUKA